MMLRPTLIFAPNLTGPLHVGSALVLWITAREARARGCDLVIRLDDRYENPADCIPEREARCIASIQQACSLLDVTPAAMYRYSERMGRYLDMADWMRERGLIVEESGEEGAPQTFLMRETGWGLDLIHGNVREYGSAVILRGTPNIGLAACCDFLDWRSPLHVRGVDLLPQMMVEHRIWGMMRELLPRMATWNVNYAHLPLVADASGRALHKSGGATKGFEFGVWAGQFPTVRRRREALENLILANVPGEYTGMERPSAAGDLWSLGMVLRAGAVRITEHGERVGVDPLIVNRGMLCSEFYYTYGYKEPNRD